MFAHHHYITPSHSWHGDEAGTRWGPEPGRGCGSGKNETHQVKWGEYGGARPGPELGGCHPDCGAVLMWITGQLGTPRGSDKGIDNRARQLSTPEAR
jgi:hypothetical protein